MLNIGVVGCGRIAQVRHLPEYLEHDGCHIVAVTDMNMDRALEIARQYHCHADASAEMLLARPEIDAVSVCVANADHAAVTIHALHAGKHVLCEKPMAITLDECQKMVDTATKSNRVLVIGHNQRLLKTHQFVRNLIASGEIGQVLMWSSRFCHGGPESWSIDKNNIWFFNRERSAYGALFDLGIHKIDLMQYLLDDHVCAAFAITATQDKKDADNRPIPVEDNAICMLHMQGGSWGTVHASWTCYGKERNNTVIDGSLGTLRIYDHPVYACIVEKKTGEKSYYQTDEIQTNEKQTRSGIIDEFVRAILTGVPSVNAGRHALSSMRATFACLTSAQTHRIVEINDSWING
ncbi:MAG: Gfo/Idh/MocA family oxidoreductase [Clostridiaceae bacterium]|jgi:predicted dehydrogenase|nr:Gfo/Idh/MocA family oxidoreductase [Clostridiaceae bacterium]